MKIEVPFLGKTKERYIEKGINDFHARLSHYVSAEIKHIRVKHSKGLTAEQQIRAEGKLLDGSLSPGFVPHCS